MSAADTSGTPLLELRELSTHFQVEQGGLLSRRSATLRAVDGVSLCVQPGEVLGLVGESGCGKTTLGRSIARLVPVSAGAVLLDGNEITRLEGEALRAARADFQMVFQDPYASLNPRRSIGATLREALQVHANGAARAHSRSVAQLLDLVGLGPDHARSFPHQLSGGQRQRVAIARALAVEPRLIIADEPVSALDVSIQAQILNLLARLCRELGLTLIFVSHDLGVVRHISDRVAVMYLGRIVELGPAADVVDAPLHPYTKALVSAVPLPDPQRARASERIILEGEPPSPLAPPPGCAFHPRCRERVDACAQQAPELRAVGEERQVACLAR